jgi:hypothetical protein
MHIRSPDLMRTRRPITPFYLFTAPQNSNVFIRATRNRAQKFPGSGIFYRRYIVSCRVQD